MRTLHTALVVLAVVALGLGGCGSADDFQAANLLTVERVVDSSGSTAPVFAAVEKTDDSGKDGELGTDDEGEGDGIPNEPIANVEARLSNDTGTITLRNETRPGVEEGRPLLVYRVDLTYVDKYGRSHSYAPTRSEFPSVEVPADATADVNVTLVPVEMKLNGLRDAILFETDPTEREAVRQWTVYVDVYAKDVLNDDDVHARGSITVRFINPIVEELTAQ
ncbi:hypothetical protein [Deferrisoma camini]|uniref:hypothetical protein n=1 Tax=Deferrisoma camini TaxID=1035120 RepID=UPI00046CFBE2|nr:hypothetical protein [Deferrisoma camini]